MKLKHLVLNAFLFFSCTKNNNEIIDSTKDIKKNDSIITNEKSTNFIQKKIKKVTWKSGLNINYSYNETNKLEFIVSKQPAGNKSILIDSTKFEYKNNNLFKITKLINSSPETIILEKTFDFINETSANGTFVKKNSRNEIIEHLEFSYTFKGKLISTYQESQVNGNIKFLEELNYDNIGNLISLYQAFYLPNNIISLDYTLKMTDWNNNGVKIQVSPPWSMQTLPGYYISNNYFKKVEGPDQITEYDVQYNDNGHIVNYNIGFTEINLEYYD